MAPRPLIGLGLTAGLLLTASALAAGDGKEAGELVRRLGDPAFTERERAADGIRHLGRDAVAALEAGLKDPDAEVRRRCAELLPLARRSDLDVRLDAFVAGPADGPAPLPGWTRFRKLAGDDRPARLLFVAVGRADRALLDTLEKDPALVGAQFDERCRRVVPRRGFRVAAAVAPPAAGAEGEAETLLLAAACSTEKNTASSQQFFNGILYQPGMRSVIRSNAAARRLLTPFIARQIEEPFRLHQAVWLARNLGLEELTENTLKPAARKQAAAAAARPDSGHLYQAAAVATSLGLHDTIEGTLKPAARTLAEKSAEKPGDLNQLFQTFNVLQSLGMRDVIDSTLKPAACRGIAVVAEKPYDQYAFHMALNLARMLDLKESVDQVLKPAAVKAVASLAQQIAKDPDKVHAALNLVQTFELKEAGEDLLKPAARRLAESAAKSGDLGKLTQAANLVGSLDLKDASEKTLQPAVRKLAAEPAGDANRLLQLANLAQKLGMKGTVDDALKPRAREVLAAAAAGRPANHGVQGALQLARALDLKEGVPVALKAARAADLNAATRGAAVMFVAEFGGKEHVGELEPLLTDTASIGSMGFNFTTIHTELRDVALAAAVTLSGQSLDDYGYPYMKFFGAAARPLSALSAHCYGFSDAAGREAALKRWKESRRAGANAAASGKASGGR